MKPLSLLKNTLTYGLGQILTRCLNLILLPFFTNYLSVSDYGIISLLTLIITFTTSTLTLGIGSSFGLCHTNSSLNKTTVVTTCFTLIAIPCTFFLIALWVWLPDISIYLFHSDIYSDLIFITGLTATLASLLFPFNLHLQFNHRAFHISSITVIFTLLSISLNILFVAFLNLGVRGQVWATFLSTACLFAMYSFSVKGGLKPHINRHIAKQILIYGFPMIPASFSLFFLQNSQRYFLDRYSSLEELGLYSVAFNIAAGANLLVSAFSQAWTPFFMEYSNHQNDAKPIFGNIFTHYTFFFGIVSLISFVFASPLVKLITPTAFHPSANIIGILTLGWIFIGFYNLMNVGIVFAKKLYLNSIMQFGAVIISWTGNILLCPYGALGAAVIFMLSHATLLIFEEGINTFYTFFRPQISWKRLLPFCIVIAISITLTHILPFPNIWSEIIWGCLTTTLASILYYFQLPKKWPTNAFRYKSIEMNATRS